MMRSAALLLLMRLFAIPCEAAGVRIKDITTVQGVRPNQLVGYGLVIGLNGTGDSLRNAPFTAQASIDAGPYGHQCPQLQHADQEYRGGYRNGRVAGIRRQGLAHRRDRLIAGRRDFAGGRLTDPVAALGARQSGLCRCARSTCRVRICIDRQGRDIDAGCADGRPHSKRRPCRTRTARPLQRGRVSDARLRNPDFATAVKIVDVINGFGKQRYGTKVAREQDLRSVRLQRPRYISAAASSPRSAS